MNRDDFETAYAHRSGIPVEQGYTLGIFPAVGCDCGADDCEGWRRRYTDDPPATPTGPRPPLLTPVESIALTIALAQVQREEPPTPSMATVCVWALARLDGRYDWTKEPAPSPGPHCPDHPDVPTTYHRIRWPDGDTATVYTCGMKDGGRDGTPPCPWQAITPH